MSLWIIVIVFSCITGEYGYWLSRKFDNLETLVTLHQKALDSDIKGMLVKIDQTLTSIQKIDTKIPKLEGELNYIQNIQQDMQFGNEDLSHNHSMKLLNKIEQILSGASQQLKLTGNIHYALIALQSADEKLSRFRSDQVIEIRKIIEKDIENLKKVPFTDISSLVIKLDSIFEKIDIFSLKYNPIIKYLDKLSNNTPVNIPVGITSITEKIKEPSWKLWWHNLLACSYKHFKNLVHISRIDTTDTVLISTEKRYFVIENIKERLMSLRLSLITLNEPMIKADLNSVQKLLSCYFDQSENNIQLFEGILKQIEDASKWIEILNFDDSLKILRKSIGFA